MKLNTFKTGLLHYTLHYKLQWLPSSYSEIAYHVSCIYLIVTTVVSLNFKFKFKQDCIPFT